MVGRLETTTTAQKTFESRIVVVADNRHIALVLRAMADSSLLGECSRGVAVLQTNPLSSQEEMGELLLQAKQLIMENSLDDALSMLRRPVELPVADINAAVKVEWMYHLGLALGLKQQHDEALRVALTLVSEAPHCPHGHYLAGMAYAAVGRLKEAEEAILNGHRRDAAMRGASKSREAYDRVASSMKPIFLESHRRSIQRHASAVNAFTSLRCESCHSDYDQPTLRWICPKCYCGQARSEEMLWEPDAVGRCWVCQKGLSAGSRHHCRSCGHLVCSSCSPSVALVSILGFDTEPVTVCDSCIASHKCVSRSRGAASSPTDSGTSAAYVAARRLSVDLADKE